MHELSYDLTEEAASRVDSIPALLMENAELRLQRDFLLELTWLDLPGDPTESTAKWRAEFEKGWTRREAPSDCRMIEAATM